MRLWALATSPQGFGLTSEAFWLLTWREWDALREVYEAPIERWSIERAQFANAHFVGQNDEPFVPADFRGRGDRAARAMKRIQERAEVERLNRRLQMMKPGERPANLPEWAVN